MAQKEQVPAKEQKEQVPSKENPSSKSETLAEEQKKDLQWYEDDIHVRGCSFDLPRIKAVYRELNQLTKNEADRILATFVKSDEKSEEDFKKEKDEIRKKAFRLTISIIGKDKQTVYGDKEDIFDSPNLPFPISVIFFTNENAYKIEANGTSPPNYFKLWLHFDKPELIDPTIALSERTPNPSRVYIRADDIGYFRAVQNIVNAQLMKSHLWYSFIHKKFIYDVGLWFLFLPYALYMTTKYLDKYIPLYTQYESYRTPLFIYAIGMTLILYRAFMGYFKWAFPVNVLNENKDTAFAHRIFFSALLSSLIYSAVREIIIISFN